ncbi:MAG: imidazole glycerol phosphate synthase subunit HisH [Pseudomonadota bacterium]
MQLAVIDYGAANLASVMFALERLDVQANLTTNPEEILAAERVLFPGVGAAKASMDSILKLELDSCIKSLKQPVMGICMGMQLLFQSSEEGRTPMLNVISEEVRHFDKSNRFSVPHIGWNTINIEKSSSLFDGLGKKSYFYFVHSYYAPVSDYTLASCQYANNFSAIIQKENFYGCQFHPEKSGENGAKILKNFVEGDL